MMLYIGTSPYLRFEICVLVGNDCDVNDLLFDQLTATVKTVGLSFQLPFSESLDLKLTKGRRKSAPLAHAWRLDA